MVFEERGIRKMPKIINITPEFETNLIEMHSRGVSLTAMAIELKVDRTTLRKICKKLELDTSKKRLAYKVSDNTLSYMTEENLGEVKRLFDLEYGKTRIRKATGFPKYIICEMYKKLGITRDYTPKRPFLGTQKVCKMCSMLKSISEFTLHNAGHGRMVYKYCNLCKKKKIATNTSNYKINLLLNNEISATNREIARLINIALKYNNIYVIKNILPYSGYELKLHLEGQFESWMNWSNRGSYIKNSWDDSDPNTWVWHIDHIIPKSDFKFNSVHDEEFKKCWALENLRPYSGKQNIFDGVNRIRHKKK